ncbi:MAG TPA: hypothetical protein VGR81_05905 [Candidatus Acidoferrales bacterium]|nr:hypothetical protein [Candidatus Acidoferrales bacterium]
MNREHSREKTVVIHSAGSDTEAMVIRGLLESAGISCVGSSSTNPFPVDEPLPGFSGSDVVVLESQAQAAQNIIADYLKSNEGIEVEDDDDGSNENSEK